MSSGWLGAFSTFGFLCGGMVTYKIDLFGVVGCYFILIVFHAGAIAVTVKHIHETPLDVRLTVSPHALLLAIVGGVNQKFDIVISVGIS